MKDKGTGAENLIWLASRQSGRAQPSSLAADDILAALTGRIAELEARVSAILAEVEPQPPRVDSESGRALSAPKADVGRGTDKMSRDARVEADDELTRASEERRMLANEMRLLREAFQEARRSQLSAGQGANAIEGQIAPDLRAAIADEMRSLLTELLADFRARPAPPPPAVEHISVETEIAAHVIPEAPEPILEEFVVDVETASPPADMVEAEAAPLDTVESIVEDVDELLRPVPSKPIVDEYVEQLRAPAPVAPIDALQALAAPPEPPIVDEYVFESAAPIVADHVEELDAPERVVPTDALHVEAEPPELAPPIVNADVFEPLGSTAPIVDDYVEGPKPPSWIETIELSAAPAEPIAPIVDQDLGEFPRPESLLPLETIDASAPPEPIIEEFVDELPRPEQIEPIAEYFAPTQPDVTITPPPLPSAPDARIAALWESASSPANVPEAASPSPAEPASFVTEEFIAETRSLEMPEAAPEVPPELAPEHPISFAPQPPMEFAPKPPMEFAPAPPTEFVPGVAATPEPGLPLEPPTVETELQSTYPTAFPELRISDQRGLHQIQVVISPIHSFLRLLETERRIRALSTVNALHLRDFRNGVATLTVSVGEAISPAEFGAVIQMLEELHLRLEGTTQSSVELRAEDEPPSA